MNRSSGILLPISSLPSPYGIGTFGAAAYAFADFLQEAGQKYWQLLPLGPTSYGDSPYQSFSTFAGNPYFVDLDLLIEDGLLLAEEVEACDWGEDPRHVDYGKIYESRFAILAKAKARGYARDYEDVQALCQENEQWLDNYALYMACKKHFGMKAWSEWEDKDIRMHRPEAVEKYRRDLQEDMELFIYIQYLFFKQWNALRAYINDLGIEIIGDLPIYVSMDSADVWADPEYFVLNEERLPLAVAGVPPDYFSEDGQLWGNPIYDWEAMAKDGYGWWIRRIEGAGKLYDVIRIDHFRGFDTYWAVPYGEKTAKIGQWKHGPGMDLVGLLKKTFPKLEFIAEDLGEQSPSVRQLLADSGFPGMKILEFAFDSDEPSDYQPHTYPRHCICYTGTHDNSPVMLWKAEAKPKDAAYAAEYLGIGDEPYYWGFIRGGMRSVALLFVAQMQDYLGLGKGHRMNVPGTASGNWTWRMLSGEATTEIAEKLYRMTKIYGRLQK